VRSPRHRPDGERLRVIYNTRAENVQWQEAWLQFLTPLHLRVSGHSASDNAIARALYVHLTNLVIMYTADRTVYRGSQWIASYADAQRRSRSRSPHRDKPLARRADEQVDVLNRLFDWIYDPKLGS